jgi:hypothetical protein
MPLTECEIANIVFNETRSLSGPGIQDARVYIAHALMNADGPRRPRSGPSTARVPASERRTHHLRLDAAATARRQREEPNATDPTSGATHFNFRMNALTGPFFGQTLRTQVGPLINSYPTPALPANGVYANTYGPPRKT